jgi:hypothetical protein
MIFRLHYVNEFCVRTYLINLKLIAQNKVLEVRRNELTDQLVKKKIEHDEYIDQITCHVPAYNVNK